MRVNEIPQLRFPQHQVACQGSITAFMVQPDTAVDRQRRNDNSGRIRADGEVGLRRTFSETRALSEEVTLFTRSIVQKATYAR